MKGHVGPTFPTSLVIIKQINLNSFTILENRFKRALLSLIKCLYLSRHELGIKKKKDVEYLTELHSNGISHN